MTDDVTPPTTPDVQPADAKAACERAIAAALTAHGMRLHLSLRENRIGPGCTQYTPVLTVEPQA